MMEEWSSVNPVRGSTFAFFLLAIFLLYFAFNKSEFFTFFSVY